MAAKGKTNIFKEKMILREEEKSLKEMLDKFQSQLNRLKIEELALVHLIRMQNAKENPQDEEEPGADQTDATANAHPAGASGMTQERLFVSDSDDDDQESTLLDMVPVGYMSVHGNGKENASAINRETLDLEVHHLADEEEEIEEDEDEEEMVEISLDELAVEVPPATKEDEMDQLRTFMDDF